MTTAVRCVFCFGRLRSGVITCRDCQPSLWIWEHLERYGHLRPRRLSHTLSQCSPPMLQKTLKSAATKLSHRRNGLASAECAENLSVKMKRSMGVASSDLSSPDSSKNPSPAPQSSSGEDGVTKHARTDRKKKGKVGRSKSGSPTKNVASQSKETMKPEVIDVEVQKLKAAGSGSVSTVIDPKETLASRIQQLFQQSSLAEPHLLSAGGAPWTASQSQCAAGDVSLQPLDDSTMQNSPVYNCAQTFCSPSPFLSGVQPGALGHIVNPAVCFQHCASSVLASQSYHSSSQTSAASQLQKRPHLNYDLDAKEGQTDLVTRQDCEVLPEKQSSAVDKIAALRKDITDTSHVLAHWDVGPGREIATVAGKAEADAERADLDSEPLDDYKQEEYHKKLRQLPRQWEYTPFGVIQQRKYNKNRHSKPHQPVEFSIMSYNILSQDLLENHPYLYSGSSSRSLEWRHRRRLLIAEIAYHSPDILNLQEVHRDHFFSYLKPRLNKLGYVGGYVKRTGDKNDGCATMWKKDKFRLLHSTPVNYCRGGLLDRDNIAIVVELQPIRSDIDLQGSQDRADDKIVVANTHLLFNPRRGDIKLAQLMVLMAEIDRHAYLGPSKEVCSSFSSSETVVSGRYCPVIMTGDFNMEPHCEMYKFLLTGKMDYEGLLVRQISGQEEGMYGRNYLLDRNFFSPRFGVTDFCQYHTAVLNRLREKLTTDDSSSATQSRGNSEEQVSASETSSSALNRENSDQGCSDTTDCETASSKSLAQVTNSDAKADCGTVGKGPSVGISAPMPVNTGHLWHHLNLVSAYRHRIERLGWKQPEVTTHHNRGKCSVDYIFYTVTDKEVHFQHDEVRLRHIKDGKLKLLARYGLMSADELDRMGGIPNSVIPSDHLSIIAKFLLK